MCFTVERVTWTLIAIEQRRPWINILYGYIGGDIKKVGFSIAGESFLWVLMFYYIIPTFRVGGGFSSPRVSGTFWVLSNSLDNVRSDTRLKLITMKGTKQAKTVQALDLPYAIFPQLQCSPRSCSVWRIFSMSEASLENFCSILKYHTLKYDQLHIILK